MKWAITGVFVVMGLLAPTGCSQQVLSDDRSARPEGSGIVSTGAQEIEHLKVLAEADRDKARCVPKKSPLGLNGEYLRYLVCGLKADQRERVFEELTDERGTGSNEPFRGLLLEYFVAYYLESSDREHLVKLFSRVWPPCIGQAPTEFCVLADAKPALKDPLLIITQAFFLSKGDSAEGIAKALARAFVGTIERGDNDMAFVLRCALWYKQYGRDVVVNPDYLTQFCATLEETVPLFMPR